MSPPAVPHLSLQHSKHMTVYIAALSFDFPSTGDVHIGTVDRGGQLEVEVNQARGLIPKPGSKNIPGMGIAHSSDELGDS